MRAWRKVGVRSFVDDGVDRLFLLLVSGMMTNPVQGMAMVVVLLLVVVVGYGERRNIGSSAVKCLSHVHTCEIKCGRASSMAGLGPTSAFGS